MTTRDCAHPQPGRVLFAGERVDGVPSVRMAVGGQPSQELPLHLAVRRHSATGFDWGDRGAGSTQLALALCIEVVGRERAERAYRCVRNELVEALPDDTWMLSGSKVLDAVQRAERASPEAGRG